MNNYPSDGVIAAPSQIASLVPMSTWLRLAGSWCVVAIFMFFGNDLLGGMLNPMTAAWVFLLLFITILAASFGVVHEADHLAEQLGEPYGTLILTLSIVSIEVILIASVFLGPGEFPTIGRDSIFAVMMIIMNLVVGICLIAGANRHGDQEFNAQGATSYLSMIALLTAVALILPNYTSTSGMFTVTQAWGVSALVIALYATFLWMQMRSHRRLFIQPPAGSMSVPPAAQSSTGQARSEAQESAIDVRAMVVRSCVLLGLILPIVLLAHYLAVVTDYGIAAAGAPAAVSGVLIAIIVFTPESITAVKAAMNNEMQRAINLCLGAFVSTVGLTVPAVLIIGLITGKQVIMGISNAEILLFVITLVLGMLTFNGQRTSPIQGYMHLSVFAVFGLILFFP
jgi:Ca2+:H+ antiporter